MRSRWVGVGVALVALTVALGSCGDDEATPSTTSGAPSTTGAETTSTTEVTSESTAPPSTTSATASATPPAPPSVPIAIPSPDDGVSPQGSGCTPPAGDALPDGVWFGELVSVDAAAGTASLDLACLFVGDAANAAATADGSPEVPVPNDYWIRNQSANTYTLPAVDDVAVLELSHTSDTVSADLAPATSGLASAATSLTTFDGLLGGWQGWLQVTDGWVVVIQQQYFP